MVNPHATASVKNLATIFKPGILFLLVLSGITAVIVAGGWDTSPVTLMYTLMGGALAASSASVLNNYIERDLDRKMIRTRGRPLPAGDIHPPVALGLGLAFGIGSLLLLSVLVNFLAAMLAIAGIVFYILIYTIWLKPRTEQNIVLGGIAGAFPPLVGWAAVENAIAFPALLIGILVVLWTPPHFWALALLFKEDYRKAGIPMLPVTKGEDETRTQILIYSILLVGTSLVFVTSLGGMGLIYLLAAGLLGSVFLTLAARLHLMGSNASASQLFTYSIWYLTLLFGAMIIDRLVSVPLM